MQSFEDREDVEEWLQPLGWDAFWRAVAPFGIELPERADCDADIAAGSVDEASALAVLKGMVRLELVQRYGLRPRDVMPWHALH
jgi:hypothetical protein